MLRRLGPFLVSFFLHLAVFVWISTLVLGPAVPPSQTFQVVEVTPIPARPTRTSRPPGFGGRGEGSAPGLSDLGLGSQSSQALLSPREEEDGLIHQRSATASLYRTRKTVLYDRLQDQIESALLYPAEFKDAAIEGSVEARFVFDEAGQWVEKRSKITATSRYLKVYVAQLARRCFKEPIAKTYLGGRDSFELRCLFVFSLTGEAAVRQAPSVSGKLIFFRSAKTFGEWNVGPFSGYGIAPSVGIDPNWILETVGEAVGRAKAKEDPLEKYRRDSAW